MDIFKPKNDQDTNNGRSVIKTGNNFQTLDTSKDVEPDFDILQNLYNFNFDDPIYYWLNSTGYAPPAITPTVTRAQTPTPSVTPTYIELFTPTPTASVTSTTTVTPTPSVSANPVTPTRTITLSPTPTITETQRPGNNSVNFNSCADWNLQNGNVTTVGSNGGPSYYGTYDQSGNVFEWNDLNGTTNSSRGLRGGDWNLGFAFNLSSAGRVSYDPSNVGSVIGFRLATSLNPLNLPYFVSVADTGNNADTGGSGPADRGRVDYLYQISQYLVTNCEYAEFLNSVASTDTYALYNASMNSDARAGINRSGDNGSYAYSVKSNMGNKPVIYVSWFDAARYCNWLHNGKPTGSQNNSTTEHGAYTLNGATTGNAVAKNVGANYSIPTENEWYKAAYYKGGGTNTGYWRYATQSNSDPACVTADSVGNGPISSNYSCSSVVVSTTPTPSVTNTVTPTPSVTSTITPTPTVTQTPTATITSTPTTTQTPTVTPSTNNPLFLASVSSNSSANARTTDAVIWNYGNFANNRNWTGLAYGNNKYLAVANNSNNYEISSDGSTWTSYSYDISHPNNLFNVAVYGNNKYLVFANSSTGLSSNNLQTWSSFILPSANWSLVAYGNNTYVACIRGSSVIATSNDGVTWTQRSLPVSRQWTDILYANNRFVLIADNTNTVLHSIDGTIWNSSTLPQEALWRCLSYGNGIYVALVYQSSLMAYSSDTISWQTGTSLPYSWTDLTYGNNTFIAVGTGAVTMTSTNGLTWTQRAINNNNWNRLIFNT